MNIISLYIILHVISVVIWVGGMIFAHQCLRPVAASLLEPPARLRLWAGVFSRFFPMVWASIILLPLTGYLMMFAIWQSMGAAPLYVHIMNGTGILMILIYLHVYFAPYQKLKRAVASESWPDGGKAINQIRMLVGINSILGVITIIIAAGGKYLPV